MNSFGLSPDHLQSFQFSEELLSKSQLPELLFSEELLSALQELDQPTDLPKPKRIRKSTRKHPVLRVGFEIMETPSGRIVHHRKTFGPHTGNLHPQQIEDMNGLFDETSSLLPTVDDQQLEQDLFQVMSSQLQTGITWKSRGIIFQHMQKMQSEITQMTNETINIETENDKLMAEIQTFKLKQKNTDAQLNAIYAMFESKVKTSRFKPY